MLLISSIAPFYALCLLLGTEAARSSEPSSAGHACHFSKEAATATSTVLRDRLAAGCSGKGRGDESLEPRPQFYTMLKTFNLQPPICRELLSLPGI